ncbi:MAG: hypothetical protein WDO73_12710 [Ignavibacteriota bacterium]
MILAKLYRYAEGVAEFVILKYEFRTVSRATSGSGPQATFGAGTAFSMLPPEARQEYRMHLHPPRTAATFGG